ncbi:MAG: hypothetical protein JSV50_12950 [Desulfobacteraceae bacterium]|nr:MAG: hypothetical protein JSV50_12950 [Desulfobacteraceae bacterium]
MKIKTTFLAFALLTSFSACQSKENSTVPDELTGVWKTSVLKYENCFFELNKHIIIFANGNLLENRDINFISKIERTSKEGQILYSIYYENLEDKNFKFSFYYDPSNGGVIRFKNQEKIEWRKVLKLDI